MTGGSTEGQLAGAGHSVSVKVVQRVQDVLLQDELLERSAFPLHILLRQQRYATPRWKSLQYCSRRLPRQHAPS